MTIKQVRHDTDPVHHVDHVVLRDHFGHELDLQIHPFVVRDKPDKPGEFEVVPVDVQAEIDKATELMKLRELAYFNHLLQRHPNHPLCLSYPENQHSAISPRQAGVSDTQQSAKPFSPEVSADQRR
jgi:hypothetical protein